MKKYISLFLILALCASLCACQSEKAIVGEWKAFGIDANAVFEEDGTGVLYYEERNIGLEWTYNSETEMYSITVETTGITYEASVKITNGYESISFAGGSFIRF